MSTSPSDSTPSDSIAERVRFWEEQDKINQELIPRVIRQNELLTKHIAEHDNLPEVAGNAIGQALAGAREEQRQQYEAALDAAKTQLGEQTRISLAEAAEQTQAAMTAHKTDLNEQADATINQGLAALREESRKLRNLLIGMTVVAGVLAIAALAVALLA